MGDALHIWEEQLRSYTLPEWDSLPELELYMDQVVLLLSRYLSFFSQGEEEKICPYENHARPEQKTIWPHPYRILADDLYPEAES